MKASAARALVLGTLLLVAKCGGDEPPTATAPSPPGAATVPQPGPPVPSTHPFEVTGIVTNDDGVPVAGAVVTMAHYLNGVAQWPSTSRGQIGGISDRFLSHGASEPCWKRIRRASRSRGRGV